MLVNLDGYVIDMKLLVNEDFFFVYLLVVIFFIGLVFLKFFGIFNFWCMYRIE